MNETEHDGNLRSDDPTPTMECPSHPPAEDAVRRQDPQPYGDLIQINSQRVVLDAVGAETLGNIAADYMALLDSSSAVHETNGDYALGLFSSGWCRLMDRASRALCATDDNAEALASGSWHCHESCWDASRKAIETGQAVDVECKGGIRLFALPIRAGDEIVGAMNFGYGDPPTDPRKLQEIADLYQVSVDDLLRCAAEYTSRPPIVTELARRRLRTSALLIGEVVRRKRIEDEYAHLLSREQQARAEAEAARVRVSGILESISDAFFALDRSWRFTYVNPQACALLRRPRTGLIGQSLWDTFPQVAESSFSEMCHESVHSQRPVAFEYYLAPYEAWFAVHAYPSPDGLSVYIRDITQRKRADQELRDLYRKTKEAEVELRQRADDLAAADRAKDEFLAMLSHELRNPLGAISSAVQLAEYKAAGTDAIVRPLEVARRQIENMGRMVNDLLDVARITQGKITLQRAPVRVDVLAASVLSNLRHQIHTKGLRLRFEADSGVTVSADALRLEQAVTNLITNSLKYTDEGLIRVSVRRSHGEAVIRVRDTGIGIAGDLLPRIFDLFAQADHTLAHASGGLGVGLTLVRELIEMHGGRVEATSKGPGRGSTFSMYLPLEETTVVLDRIIAPVETNGTLCRILLVEDNIDAAETMVEIFEVWGHEARAVHDGAAALAVAPEYQPDLILLDIGLPGMDGYEVARRLRRDESLANVRLVALTGYGQDSDRRQALEAGFQDHLVKPVDLDRLRRLLSEECFEPQPASPAGLAPSLR